MSQYWISSDNATNKLSLSNNESQVYMVEVVGQKLQDLEILPYTYTTSVEQVSPDSVAARAGIQAHDKILSVNGLADKSWFQYSKLIRDNPGHVVYLVVDRAGVDANISLIPESVVMNDGQIIGRIGIMPSLDEEVLKSHQIVYKRTMVQSVVFAYQYTVDVIRLTMRSIVGLVSNKLSLDNLGGPISIAKSSAEALNNGIISFVGFLGLLSVSIGIFNLIPLPVLDGGQIILACYELLTGSKIRGKNKYIIALVGVVIILMISGFAMYNDLIRLFK